MMTYFQFYRDKGWHPRQVDLLNDDEEYWLPVMEHACSEASEVWAGIQSK